MKKIFLLFLTLALVLTLAACGAEEPPALTISGDGVSGEQSLTLAALQKADSRQAVFSTVNNFPTKKYVKAEGCSLAALLEPYLTAEATLITVSADDGYSQSFTLDQILAEQSYYDLAGDPHPVPALLAWAYTDAGDAPPAEAEAIEGLRLIFGQNSPHAPNAMAGVQNATSVVVSCEPVPQLPPCDFALTADGLVEFVYERMDQTKIYYTIDGSEPDPATSPVYNPSTSNFQPELNAPLDLPAGTVIRARVTAYGWLASDIAEYTVK